VPGVLGPVRSPIVALFIGWIAGLLWVKPLCASTSNSWILLLLLGGVGTACLHGRLSRPLSLLGAVLWGMTMASTQNLARSGLKDEPETNRCRQVRSVDVLRAWPPRGPVQRSLVRDQSGRKWVVEGKLGLIPGTQVLMVGQERTPSCKAHAWDFDEAAHLAAKGVSGVLHLDRVLSIQRGPSFAAAARAQCFAWGRHARNRLMGFDSPEGSGAGLLLGLSTGDRSGLSRSTREAFSGVGLAHLTAVSGYHVGLVLGMVSLGLRFMVGWRWSTLFAIPAVWVFVLVCGAPPSAVRAAGMATWLGGGVALGRRMKGLSILAVVGLLLLAFSPWLIHDLGTRLSFSATVGILLWFQNREVRPGWFRMALAIPLVATAFTAPFTLSVFGRFPTAFQPANLLATPVVPLLSLLAALLVMLPFSIAESLAPAALWMANGAAQGVERIHALCPPVRLVVPTGILIGMGMTLLVSCLLGMVSKVRVGLCLLLALAGSGCLLRMGQWRMETFYIHALPGGDVVVMAQGKASVFERNGPKNSTAWKWKTRTVLERVSMKAPLPIRADPGGRLMWSDAALLARSPRDGRVWVSSPRSRSESLDPHRLPKTPCP